MSDFVCDYAPKGQSRCPKWRCERLRMQPLWVIGVQVHEAVRGRGGGGR